jgi:methylglutaconyl-CoA hydratase
MYKTIEVDIREDLATVWLNRPEVRNAFSGMMIQELDTAFDSLSNNEAVKVIILRGRGKVFCAGADLNWMKCLNDASFDVNLEEGKQMARCFQKLAEIPKPVIAVAHGAALGGGIGLIAVADLAICDKETVFAFSEVKLGLVPAVISPYVISKIGAAKARELMLTARKFTGTEAMAMNLVNWAVDERAMSRTLDDLTGELLENSPMALKRTKDLINRINENVHYVKMIDFTADIITQARKSGDGQEGMQAFIEKRKPVWK